MPSYPAVSGTGHRRLTDSQVTWLHRHDVLPKALSWLADEFGTQWIVSGMALGFDQILAEQTLALGMKLHAVVPFPNQDLPWTENQQDHWRDLLDLAHQVTFASPTNPTNRRQAAALLHKRNDVMFDASQAVIACWDRNNTKGGTYSAIVKAVRRKTPILWIDPSARTIRPTRHSDWPEILIR